MHLWLIETVLSNAVVATGIACLAAVIARLRPRAPLVHALWLLVLIKLITPPIIPISLPRSLQTALLPQHPEQMRFEHDQASVSDEKAADLIPDQSESEPAVANSVAQDDWSSSRPSTTADVFVPTPDTQQPADRHSGSFAQRSLQVLLLIWAAGAFWWFGRSGLQILRFSRTLRMAKSPPRWIAQRANDLATQLGLRQSPQLLLVPHVVAPMLWAPGRRASLILPSQLVDRLDDSQLTALLAHELAHLRCRGHWVRRLELLVMGIYWWHPVVWWVCSRIRQAEEEVCDAWVVSTLPDSSETYATALLTTVDFLSGWTPRLPMVASGISHFHLLKRRISMIMQGDPSPRLSSSGWMIILSVALVGLPVSATLAQPDDQPPERRVGVSTSTETRAEAYVVDTDPEVGLSTVDDKPAEDEAIKKEIIDELAEGVAEADKDINDAIAEARDDIRNAVQDLPDEARAALRVLDVRRLVREATAESPKSVRMFVEEVDPARIIKRAVGDSDRESENFSEAELAGFRDIVAEKLTEKIAELSKTGTDGVQQVRTQITREVRNAPPAARRVIASMDFERIMNRATRDLSPIGRQVAREIDVPGTVKRALKQPSSEQRRRNPNEDVEQRGSRRERLLQRLDKLLNEAEAIRAELRAMDGERRRRR